MFSCTHTVLPPQQLPEIIPTKNSWTPSPKSSASKTLTPRKIARLSEGIFSHVCCLSKMLVHSCRPNSSHDSTCTLLLDLLPRSETTCEKCCLPHSCSTARRLMFGNELAKRAQTRTNVAQHSDDTLTASTDHRRWDAHESETTHAAKSCRDTDDHQNASITIW